MTQTAAKQAKGAVLAPRVLVDEELWFGTFDEDSAEKVAAESMAAAAGKVVGAKPFPESTRKLAELARSETSQPREMVLVLEQDPALSAKLLKIVNSAGFGLRQQCTSVRHAVALVGSQHLYQMATTASVLDLFDSESQFAVQILEHSSLVGAFARHLGAHLGLAAEELFTAGVLHDIGKLMMLDSTGEHYHNLVGQCEGQADALHVLEREEYGFDHGVLAAHVLKAWNIPEPVPKVVAWVHQPARAYEASSIISGLVQTVRFADALVYAMASAATAADAAELAKHEAASYLDISEAQLGALWPELEVLRDRTLKQHHGIEEDESPKGSSKTRLRTSSVAPALEGPKNFPCVDCGQPSFGATCPVCKGYVCPEHPLVDRRWCTVCEAEFADFSAKTKFPIDNVKAGIGAAVLIVLTTVVARVAHLSDGVIQGLLAGALLTALGAGVFYVGKRNYIHSRFANSRPDRSISHTID
jgi:HD-like signal output (HDOD) protein